MTAKVATATRDVRLKTPPGADPRTAFFAEAVVLDADASAMPDGDYVVLRDTAGRRYVIGGLLLAALQR